MSVKGQPGAPLASRTTMWRRSVGLAVALELAGCATTSTMSTTPTMPAPLLDGAPPAKGISPEQIAYIAVGAVEMALSAALMSYAVTAAASKRRTPGSLALISVGIGALMGGVVLAALVARPPQPQALDWVVVTVPMGLGSIVSLVSLLRRGDKKKATPVALEPVTPVVPATTTPPTPPPPRRVFALVFVGAAAAAAAFAGYAVERKCVLAQRDWSAFRDDAAADRYQLLVETRPSDEPVTSCALLQTERGQEIRVAVE